MRNFGTSTNIPNIGGANSTVLQYPMHNEETHGARTQFFALRTGNNNNMFI